MASLRSAVVLCLFLACGRVALIDSPDSGTGTGTGGGLPGGGTAGGATAGGGSASGGSAGGGSAGGGSAGGGSAGGGSAGGGTAGGRVGGGSAGGAVAGGHAGGGQSGGGLAGGAGGGAGNPCTGLTAGPCRANPLCTPDFCFQCSCRPGFAQCRLKSAPPFQCPAFGCPQPQCCADDSVCGRPLLCIASDTPMCGTCNNTPSTCATDTDCNTATTGNVCRPRACACTGQTDCLPGCSVSGCSDGETCDVQTQRCEQTRCTATPCPSGFNCVLGPTGNVCVRRACMSDLDCGDIHCVQGACRTSLGTCGQLVP